MFSPGSNDTHRYDPLDFVRRDARMATDYLGDGLVGDPGKADDTWAAPGVCLLLGADWLRPVVALDCRRTAYAHRRANDHDGQGHFIGVARHRENRMSASPDLGVDSFNQYIALEPETRNSAVFNVNMATSLWNNGLISAATETSDFDIRELRRQPMTIFIGCTIAELSIFRPLIRILFQQIHDLMMVKIPGADEPHQVLLMLDEFYHVGRMDSLISKITISAGYGFRMAIVMQDIAQLDELYGKNTRITTVSGSQIKLFIQINDLETSDFVSEMLGETTQVYKTPIQRPGQGIFAPRVWAPHYTPRPLRSPLELREMSARLSILMVKNSRSFELTKIRHYADKPYRPFYEETKAMPPVLPALRDWQDETLGGAINPALDQPNEAAEVVAAPAAIKTPTTRKAPVRLPPRKTAESTKPSKITPISAAPLTLIARPELQKPARKALSLGGAPPAPAGESCDVRHILASAQAGQNEDFDAMIDIFRGPPEQKVQKAVDALNALHRSFGEEKK